MEVFEFLHCKWSMPLIMVLKGAGCPLRFVRIQKCMNKISHRELSKLLKTLAHHELVTRTVYAEVPPRVEYELTELGKELAEAMLTFSKAANTLLKKAS